jgi:hypothetical protein
MKVEGLVNHVIPHSLNYVCEPWEIWEFSYPKSGFFLEERHYKCVLNWNFDKNHIHMKSESIARIALFKNPLQMFILMTIETKS